jgi:hypothetical protein
VRIVLPPIHPDLLGFIDRAHQQADSNREQLNIRQRNTHVARDYQSFVENAIQNIDQIRSSRSCRHPIHGFRFFLLETTQNTRSARLMLNAAATACQRMEGSLLEQDCARNFAGLQIPSCWLLLPDLLTIFVGLNAWLRAAILQAARRE